MIKKFSTLPVQYNMPELMAVFREVADIKTSDMLDIPGLPSVHGGKAEIITTETTPAQKAIMAEFVLRADAIRAGRVKPEEDNMLKLTSEARMMAIDPRLVDPNAENDPESKLNACINEVYDCLGKMVCWHGRYRLGDQHNFSEPRDFLQELLFSEYSSGHGRNNPVFEFLKSGKARDAKLEYNRSTREWELLENQHWTAESDWYVSSSYAASLKDDVPDWFLDDCLSALSTGELFSLVEQMEGMMILPLYLYDHSGITMNTTGFSCPWDSGQVGWIYADRRRIEAEYGKVTPETVEKARQVLEGEVKSYDYFLTGQCYGFQLFREDVEVDSCWGFLGEIRDVQDDVKSYLPEDCDPAIVELLQFRYEELDIGEYLEELREETEGLDCEVG